MKTSCSSRRNDALTLIEVMVVICIIAFFAAMLFPATTRPPVKASRIHCISNLKQVGLAYVIWAGDHRDKYPMEISVTNGGTLELAATGNAVVNFQIMSNVLFTPKTLFCPLDRKRVCATNFSVYFTASNISYFVGLDANINRPETLLSGDNNFLINSLPVAPGLVEVTSNTPIAWNSDRHARVKSRAYFFKQRIGDGNIALADGSVQSFTTLGLQQALQKTGLATNRLAIP